MNDKFIYFFCPRCRNRESMSFLRLFPDDYLCPACGKTYYSQYLKEKSKGMFAGLDVANPIKNRSVIAHV